MVQDPDKVIIEQVLAGNKEAYDAIVIKYQRQIIHLIMRLIDNLDDAVELAQKVFLKAYTSLDRFKGLSTFKTWLYAIAINQSRNALRNVKKLKLGQDIDDLVISQEPRLLDELINEERNKLLKSALQKLPDKQRRVVFLRIKDELSFAEIAQALDITENTAKVNFHHAVNNLRKMVNEPGQW